jgi:hypothetical protein
MNAKEAIKISKEAKAEFESKEYIEDISASTIKHIDQEIGNDAKSGLRETIVPIPHFSVLESVQKECERTIRAHFLKEGFNVQTIFDSFKINW